MNIGKKFYPVLLILLITVPMFVGGCASTGKPNALLSRSSEPITSPWNSYEEAEKIYNSITCGNDSAVSNSTTVEDLKKMGIHKHAPNIQILDWLSVEKKFLHSPTIKKEDLPMGVQAFLDSTGEKIALEINAGNTKSHGEGNFLLDVTNFKKNRRVTGWWFRGFILIVNGKVVYKTEPPEGIAKIDRPQEKINPLGPLQNLGDDLKPQIFMR